MHSHDRPRRVVATPAALSVVWSGGEVSEFDSLWLRDNRPEDRDAPSGQRLIDITDVPENPTIRSAALGDSAVIVEWHGEPHAASFDLGWLWKHSRENPASSAEPEVHLWLEGRSLDPRTAFAWLPMDMLADPARRASWLGRLLRDGIAFLSEVPACESSVLDAAASIGSVAETNYGRTFDVRSVPQPENLAYSDVGLGLHTDNPYREPVPGFQALHALVAAPAGGASLLADGFAIAAHLRATQPEAFERLTRHPVGFRYQSKDADLQAQRPLIQLSPAGAVAAVHYNNRSIAPLRLAQPDLRPFYAAYRRFAVLLQRPEFQATLQLAAGEMMVFDNQRVLHGRTAYSSTQHARHLRGCYLTRDSVRSQAAVAARERT